MKYVVSIAAVLVALSIAATAEAAPAFRVLDSSSSSGDYALTTASADKSNARALYLRGYGRGLEAQALVVCSRGVMSVGSKWTSLGHIASGRLYRLKQPFAGDCQVTASLTGEGRIKLQILA